MDHEEKKVSDDKRIADDGGSNDMAVTELAAVATLRAEISVIIGKIGKMSNHRSYSLAITKLDEARHWLNDRKDRLPSQR